MLTLFTTAKPFTGHNGVIQRNALKSWTLLHPEVDVILFGDDAGAADVSRELGIRHEPEVTRSPRGMKHLNYIFIKAQELARHDIVCYCNCDIILMQDFRIAIERVSQFSNRFLMLGRRWDVDISDSLDFSEFDWEAKAQALAKTRGFQRTYRNIDYFLFRRGLYSDIPRLVIGRIWWDHWLVWQARHLGASIIDVSAEVCAVHQNHDYGYHPEGKSGVWEDEEAKSNFDLAGQGKKMLMIEDADYRLTPNGVRKNIFYRLVPVKRWFRPHYRRVRDFVRPNIWHPLLGVTRSVRHAFGLKRSSLPVSIGPKERRLPDE
jgi:hypothetical protein